MNLSEVQRRAVDTTEGPVLVLAGAGSGKTGVLTARVAHLINDLQVRPENILAITFTNKAAAEMKERTERMIDVDIRRLTVCTFHSMCARFLRYDADKIGFSNSFAIYDTAASLEIVKLCSENAGIAKGDLKPRQILGHISRAKNAAGRVEARHYFADTIPQYAETLTEIYDAYNERLRAENAMDFDDLLLNMLTLLKTVNEVREYYQNRFKYVLVDEYQDTNSVQYELVRIMCDKYKNIFVVGDDDQSIYSWRGAEIGNILKFDRDYPGATVIKLEQNYRSHSKIIDVANSVIEKSEVRKPKRLWSANKEGEKPYLFCAINERDEADFVTSTINKIANNGGNYSDIAILYRMNAQSRSLEEVLRRYGVPYRVYGGISFYERKEIKDMLAYLTVLDNPTADTALLRVINVPKRGIGKTTIERLREHSMTTGLSIIEQLITANLPQGVSAAKLKPFLDCYEKMADETFDLTVPEILQKVFEITNYEAAIKEEDDIESRMQNIEELINSAHEYEKTTEEPSLTEFLSTVSLVTDLDTTSETGSVTLMTLHSAKGLEFENVFLVGMEENVFPSMRAVEEGNVEEERRLCYVGITRAKQRLFMSHCQERNLYSGFNRNKPSRFLFDIPEDSINTLNVQRKPAAQQRQKPNAPEVKKPSFNAVREKAPSKLSYNVGMKLSHPKFGIGVLQKILLAGDDKIGVIAFAEGEKKMILAYAPLTEVK